MNFFNLFVISAILRIATIQSNQYTLELHQISQRVIKFDEGDLKFCTLMRLITRSLNPACFIWRYSLLFNIPSIRYNQSAYCTRKIYPHSAESSIAALTLVWADVCIHLV